jgi:CheY-like chemotaxis protein
MDGGRSRTYTILVVEDDPASATALARLLRLLGHTVKTAAGVAPALALARQERFDLLLCDIALPDGSGCDLMRAVTALYPVTGIAISGYSSAEDVAASRQAGFAAHWVKPLRFENLDAMLKEVRPTAPAAGRS